jgi:D-alanyl-D-alanine carboxypeptidase/D-alanyl-D-alanine-endopeptidase (penicillin-binding protein 4)
LALHRQRNYPSRLSFLFSSFLLCSLSIASAQSLAIPDPSLRQLLDSKELKSAHVGVFVYDDSTKRVIADYQGDKYFVPASNTKLFSLYAGMKYLDDSLVGIRFTENDTALFIYPAGDPSFLHPDFQSQPVLDFLKKTKKTIYLVDWGWQETPLGVGWSWDDYNEDYSVERSQFPIYGNFIRWKQERSEYKGKMSLGESITATSSPEITWKTRFQSDTLQEGEFVKRVYDSNVFTLHLHLEKYKDHQDQDVPFITNNLNSAVELLKDTLGKTLFIYTPLEGTPSPEIRSGYSNALQSIHSRPADSVFKPMMFRSDNFFAEQTLLMVSRKRLGILKDDLIIDSLLSGPLADLPQKPSWVDGSGLSRFNLFSPLDFVTLLVKFKNEFGMDRMKRILPTGGTGTLKNYYHSDSGSVYAKTGSLTGVICISGYIYTVKKRLLEFSILVNNNEGGGSAIRRQVENYVDSLRKNN